ncbi:uncharacterized protein isoform X2 [Leptinotarsa decemlineata]|uniref:uncharacterized protein isoform X1 n=1 Tax=Leptinotarsa decemlineata TaxID=7539 RepID=UPI003D30A78A
MDQETKENLINEINMNSGKSIHQISSEMNIYRTSSWRHLEKGGLKCYKIHISPKLHRGDPERRLEFCNWIIRRPDFPVFLENVIWTEKFDLKCDYKDRILDPHIFDGILNEETYHQFFNVDFQRLFGISTFG